MTRLRVYVDIDAPPARVWAAVRDIASHPRWMHDAVAIRFVTPQREGVGTTFDCDTKVGPFRLVDRMEVVEWKPRRAMGITHAGTVSGRGRFVLQPRRFGRRTRFVWDERLRFPVWFGGPIGSAIARAVLRRIWRRNLANLKRLVEG
ncbi:MAG TPA: SRPBCC family protein [Acidimicrobiales bacterium]